MFHISETFEKNVLLWCFCFLFPPWFICQNQMPSCESRRSRSKSERSQMVKSWVSWHQNLQKQKKTSGMYLIWSGNSFPQEICCFALSNRSCSPVRRNNRCPSVASTKPSGPQDLAVRFLTLNPLGFLGNKPMIAMNTGANKCMTHMTDYVHDTLLCEQKNSYKAISSQVWIWVSFYFKVRGHKKKSNKASIKMFPSPDHPSIFKRITRDDLSKLRAMRSFSSWVGAERPLAAIVALGKKMTQSAGRCGLIQTYRC